MIRCTGTPADPICEEPASYALLAFGSGLLGAPCAGHARALRLEAERKGHSLLALQSIGRYTGADRVQMYLHVEDLRRTARILGVILPDPQ